MSKRGFVYILTNKSNTVLYTGVTSDLVGRIQEHKNGTGSAFTSKYRVFKLVYYEVADDILSAIAREKQIKSWNRDRKVELINGFNPKWEDLSSKI
ncbi:MAG TPA: GIY-YIG nuclease family protein [candidate division Zixibacteria bacterium]|nr:GIY-YIG nuclease family protein [candidate division Zixibacteria bacterium]